jgi:hypothetical protein
LHNERSVWYIPIPARFSISWFSHGRRLTASVVSIAYHHPLDYNTIGYSNQHDVALCTSYKQDHACQYVIQQPTFSFFSFVQIKKERNPFYFVLFCLDTVKLASHCTRVQTIPNGVRPPQLDNAHKAIIQARVTQIVADRNAATWHWWRWPTASDTVLPAKAASTYHTSNKCEQFLKWFGQKITLTPTVKANMVTNKRDCRRPPHFSLSPAVPLKQEPAALLNKASFYISSLFPCSLLTPAIKSVSIRFAVCAVPSHTNQITK